MILSRCVHTALRGSAHRTVSTSGGARGGPSQHWGGPSTPNPHNPASPSSTDLQVDGDDERGGGHHGEGLVVRGRLPVLPHGLEEGAVGDEEDDEGHEDAVEQADEELLEVKQHPLLARQVKLWEFQTQLVVHVLQGGDSRLKLR